MKGILKFITSVCLGLLLAFSVSANDLSQYLDSETKSLLSEIGMKNPDFESVFNVTPKDVFETVFGIFKGNMKEPIRFLVTMCAVSLILVFMESMVTFSPKNKLLFETVGGLFAVTVCIPQMTDAVSIAVTAVETAGGFMKALIPVLAATIASSGGALMSVFWKSTVFSASQTVASVATRFMSPCCGLIMGIGVLDSLNSELHLSAVSDYIKKTALWIFSVSATLFTAFLSLKGILASSADTLTAKGAKLLIGSLPVVGSQLSEAYSSVVGSLALMKSGTAVYAIIALCVCTLPAVSQLVLWVMALKTATLVSTVLGQNEVSSLLKTFSSALTVLNMCVIFVLALFVISIGIILTVKAGT